MLAGRWATANTVVVRSVMGVYRCLRGHPHASKKFVLWVLGAEIHPCHAGEGTR